MLEAIAALGAYDLSRRRDTDSITPLLPMVNATHVVALGFDHEPVAYRGAEVLEYDPARVGDYLLTDGPTAGPLGSPTAMVTDAEKTFRMRLVGWIKKVKGHQAKGLQFLPSDQRRWLQGFLTEFEQRQETILADVITKVGEYSSKRNRLLVTVCFVDEGERRWVGDSRLPFRAIYRHLLEHDVFGKASANGVCSVCLRQTMVSGRIGSEVFPFATFDKPGFIAGGMDSRLTWRNLPICMDCFLHLKSGRAYVDKEMLFRFSGVQYWLIPKFMVDLERSAEALDVLRLWEKRQSLSDDVARRIMGDEDGLLDTLAELKDFMTLSFVFLERTQSMERILMSADDVVPSRLRRMFSAKDHVDQAPFLEASGMHYDFGRLRPFFSSPKGGGQEKLAVQPFLDVVGSVLRGQRLDRDWFLSILLRRIRQDVANIRTIRSRRDRVGSLVSWLDGRESDGYRESHWTVPVEAWMNLEFLGQLGIIHHKGGERQVSNESTDPRRPADWMNLFFDQYPGTFYGEAPKAAFTLGSLTQMLLDVQYQDRQATPFLKYLKGLRLTAQDLRVLLPRVQNKLREYDKFGWSRQWLAQAASHYLITADKDLARLSPDEVSYYFVLGMNMLPVVWDCMPAKDGDEEGGADISKGSATDAIAEA